ncbi:MAG: hypothetical protein K2Q23_12000 [Bryobacteraceae bacterium]|nr:hypothetical protein [Bryobacteraceae bacterium]
MAALPLGRAQVTNQYQAKRAELLRQMAELRAKLNAIEVELQLLEEERGAQPEKAPSAPDKWRTSTLGGGGGGEEERKKTAGPRCQALTRDGKRCIRAAEPGHKYCWQHANLK